MVLIFVGALFTVLNVTFEFPSGVVLGFLPDFVGYILIHVGTDRLLQREPYLKYQMYNSVIALRFLIGLSALAWLADLFLPWVELELLGLFLAIFHILLAGLYWVTFVHSLEDVEREHAVDLVTDFLMLGVVLWTGARALFIIRSFTEIELFLFFSQLAIVCTTILFIIELFRAMRRYEYV